MFSLRKFSTAALAALCVLALPAWSALAKDDAVKAPAQEQSAKEQPKTSPGDPILRVNGTTITRLERDRALKVMLAQNKVQEPLPTELLLQAQEAALDQLTSAELLYQEAAKVELKDLDKQIAEKIAKNRARFATDAEFESALKGVDMTLRDMQEFTRKDLVISNYIDKRFTSKVTVSDAEARKFYDDNLDKYFQKPESARASHILIGVDEKAGTEEHTKAKEKAEALLKRVQAGEDFAALAKAESTCPSASQGGDLGFFTRGQMVTPFEHAAFDLNPGEISNVVETQFGYHIIKLTEKQKASTAKFIDVKGKIVEHLKQEKAQKGVVDLVAKLKEAAKIEKM